MMEEKAAVGKKSGCNTVVQHQLFLSDSLDGSSGPTQRSIHA